jgi:hypothetical protein
MSDQVLGDRASAARFAHGRRERGICGGARADTLGTPSTRAASARNVYSNGQRRSACPALDGRRIPPGTSTNDRIARRELGELQALSTVFERCPVKTCW